MYRVNHSQTLPDNFDDFIREIAAGIGELYGPEAARIYQETAHDVIQASLQVRGTYAFVAQDGRDAAGILLAFERHNAGHINFIHVLQNHRAKGIEDGLVRECVRTLRDGDIEGIISECVPFCALDVDGAYRSLGFEHVPRALMTAAPDQVLSSGVDGSSKPLLETQYPEAAAVIVDAYTGHAGHRLHVEVSREEHALAFVERVAAGEYGPVHPDYLRAIFHSGRMAGAIFGCQVAPEYGFVLQVAVRRSHQRQGVGKALLADVAAAFRRQGMKHMALGVTLASPALTLYQRLGFQLLRDIDAYTWWRR